MFSAQIDYVIDAINAVPQEMLDDYRVRIATGILKNTKNSRIFGQNILSRVWSARRHCKSF